MSYIRPISRWLFTIRWRSVRFERKPKPSGFGIRGTLTWIRKHWKLTILLVTLLPFLLGVTFNLLSGQTFSIYDDYGVEEVKVGYEGGIWDLIWMIRGQPPGYEHDPDGLFVVNKVDGSGNGLNGPLNLLFLPFEFVIVDMMIYAPAMLMGGIDIVTNIDLFTGYFFPIALNVEPIPMGRLWVSMGMSGSMLAVPVFLIAIISPFLVGWFGLPLLKFILFWSVFNGVNLLKVLIILTIVVSIIAVPIFLLESNILTGT